MVEMKYRNKVICVGSKVASSLYDVRKPEMCRKAFFFQNFTVPIKKTVWHPPFVLQSVANTKVTLMCSSIGTRKNNKFSICSTWKIYYF